MRITDVLQTRRTTESILYKHIDLKLVRKSVKIIPNFRILITTESNVSNKLVAFEKFDYFCTGKYFWDIIVKIKALNLKISYNRGKPYHCRELLSRGVFAAALSYAGPRRSQPQKRARSQVSNPTAKDTK